MLQRCLQSQELQQRLLQHRRHLHVLELEDRRCQLVRSSSLPVCPPLLALTIPPSQRYGRKRLQHQVRQRCRILLQRNLLLDGLPDRLRAHHHLLPLLADWIELHGYRHDE